MPNNSKSKLKLLYIKQILEDETDAEHGISMTRIIERLNEFDIPAERKGVYRDIQTLRDFGIEIQTYQRCPVEYAIARRDFSLSELMLLVDAVEFVQVPHASPIERAHNEPEAPRERPPARAPQPSHTRCGTHLLEK